MGIVVATVVPTGDDIFTILGNVFDTLLDNCITYQGQTNRVPEPKEEDFIEVWPINSPRLATNVDTYADCVFTGSINDVLTVTAIDPRFTQPITPRAAVFATGVTPGTRVLAQLTGPPGGIGTYSLTVGGQTVGSRVMAAGVKQLMESTDMLVQVDVHGPNSWDNAQTIANVWRDSSGVNLFNLEWEALYANTNYGLTPLWCDDPRQLPFTNDQDQTENRWSIIAHIQAKQTLTLPQQFADELEVTLVDADTYSA